LTTDVAEAFGGTFNGAYEESYAVALKSGMSEEQADTWAIDAATTSATAAATFALISAGVGGQALEKMYISGGAGGRLAGFFDDVARRIENGATVFIKEAGTETLEEGGTAAVLESLLFTIDPTRDVSGNIAINGFLGGLTAGPISGTTALFASDTGNPIADAVLKYNPKISALLGQENLSQEALMDGLETAGISGALQTDLMNFLYDEVYTSTAEAVDALESLGLPYTPEDVTNTTGSTPDADLDDELASYWAMAYGNDNDSDGDGIPNNQDPNPSSPYTDAETPPSADPVDPQIEADRLAAEQARLAQEEADRLAEVARLADIADREAAQEAARLAAAEAARLAEEAAIAREAIATGERDVIADKVGIRAVEDDPDTEEDEYADATGIYKEIEDLLAQGDSIEEAIAKVAGDLGETEEAILTALGTTEDNLREEFETGLADVTTKLGDMETDILYKMKEYQDQNLTADEALSKAIDDVSTDLGKTKEEILTELGETEETLITRFDEGMADLGLEIGNVANFVGKPAGDITATDVDFYADYLAQQEVLSEADRASFVPTDQQLQYDVNNDGVIDAADQALVQGAFGGNEVALGGKFASTGLYAYNDAIAAQQKQEAEQQFKESKS